MHRGYTAAVKRIALVATVVGVALAGLLAAYALADSPPPPSTRPAESRPAEPSVPAAPDPSGRETTRTAAAATTTTAARPRTPEPRPSTIPTGVTIAGVHVGGLAYGPAYSAVSVSVRSRLVLELGGRQATVSPSRLGTTASVGSAVRRALHGRPGAKVRMTVSVRRSAVESLVASLARRDERRAGDARVVLRRLAPVVVPEQVGHTVRRARAVAAIVHALVANERGPIELPERLVEPKMRASSFHSVIVIRRDSNLLSLYRQAAVGQPLRVVRRFRVATGQASYPTPLGSFEIVVMERDPWWYPPDSPWAHGATPIPPGPGNPLGTRWMGLSAPGVGIHGTPDAASIGYSASHGCIRMYIPSAEWLYNHVSVGTPVLIVPA